MFQKGEGIASYLGQMDGKVNDFRWPLDRRTLADNNVHIWTIDVESLKSES